MEERTKIRGFKDLIVWQRSLALAVEIYKLTKEFPREEIYGITSQI
ncbi:MAG: four helix bundle protein, partial [Chloroflexi bacterium]|nr:four helix bundle protein [Chloroflexota bacterium]